MTSTTSDFGAIGGGLWAFAKVLRYRVEQAAALQAAARLKKRRRDCRLEQRRSFVLGSDSIGLKGPCRFQADWPSARQPRKISACRAGDLRPTQMFVPDANSK